MAVPKKRTSKAKKNIRKANWKRKATKQAEKAVSLQAESLRTPNDTEGEGKKDRVSFGNSEASIKKKTN